MFIGAMSKMKLVGSLLWKPFNLYFSDVIEKFRFHTKLFRLEMRVTSDTEALNFYTVWEERMIRREEIDQESVADIAERNTIGERQLGNRSENALANLAI